MLPWVFYCRAYLYATVGLWTRIITSLTARETLRLKVARYSFSRSVPPKFERKLRRHKQRFGKIDTTVVLDKDENLL